MWRRRSATGTAPPAGGEPADGDREIVLRAMVDRRAFAPLYEKYLTAVYRRCRNRLRDADEAWDATGVTFHKALAALDGFQGGSFEGWLYRIADNACIDVHRARRPHLSLDADFDHPPAGPDPEEEAIAAMDREQLEQALRQLPPRRERIVRLHLAGLKGKEIAARLGLSHDAVRQEQRRALVQLADLLGVDRERKEGRDG
ncbi:MAG TPA: sigma-70 family RNA polymerase sigma factor [Thermomicrobiales bacterium]|jgi:RNA polymerase sigma-70 factor (ECF subfamily)